MSNKRLREPLFVAVGVAMAAVIFAVDIMTGHGVAVGVAYVAVLLLVCRSERPQLIPIIAIGCSVLIIVGTFLSPPGTELWGSIANCGLSVFAIWVIAFICRERFQTLRVEAEQELRLGHDELERRIQKRTAELTASRERMDLALKSSLVGTWDWNMADGTVVWDEYVHAVFGMKPGTFGGDYASFEKMLVPEDRKRVTEEVMRAVEGKAEFDTEFRVIWPDGSMHFAAGRGKVYRDASGNPIQMTGVNWDVTDRRIAEEAAHASEERLNLALKSSGVGTWNWSAVDDLIVWDDYIHPLFGLTPGTFSGKYDDFLTMLDPRDQDRVFREVVRAVEKSATYETEYRVIWPDGSLHWLGSRGKLYRDAAGQPVRMTGVCWDATDLKQAEEAVRASEERLNLALESAEMGAFDIDLTSDATWRTLAHDEIFGYSKLQKEWGFEQFINHVLPEDRESMQTIFSEALGTGQMNLECRIVRLDQEIRWISAQGRVYHNEQREPTRLLGVVSDITARKEMEAELKTAREAAESANRAKSSFLANMSHEIRTPMNGIIGMAQLLSQTELRSHQQDYLATINESAHILLRLLNDILDFSKIEAGKLELECVDFHLSNCVARAAQLLSLRAAEKGLEIACRVAPEIPHYLQGDPGRLQQVLVNLLGNAHKFTEEGEIFVNFDVESIKPETIRLHASVTDTGIGIPAEKLEKIFLPFEQAESSTTRRFGGSGLGLTISRQLVGLMHGRMWAESEPGKGSTFHFTVELGISPQQKGHTPAEFSALNELPVLIVDDNATNRRVLNELLAHWRMRPVLADSAVAARRALQEAEESHHPIRLILLDHHMPVEDGLHFAESIQHRPGHEQCPIILISSGMLPTDTDHCQKIGIRRLMSKPVIASELLDEILNQFGQPGAIEAKSVAKVITSSSVQPRRVLLAEDNEINRRVAIGLLRSRGHQVVVVVNGLEAVNLSAEQEFDVILMDMQMPVMDGYEATRVIRQREQQTGGHIPIVAMTAEALKGDREICLEVGMDDYVSKPVAPLAMYRAVEQFAALSLGSEPGL